MSKTVLFQIIQFSISTQFKCMYSLIVKTFLFRAIQFNQTIQYSISMLFALFNLLIGPLSGATTPGQRGPGRNSKKGVFRIPQSSSIAGTSPSHFVSCPGLSLVCLTPREKTVGVFYSPSQLGNRDSLLRLLFL